MTAVTFDCRIYFQSYLFKKISNGQVDFLFVSTGGLAFMAVLHLATANNHSNVRMAQAVAIAFHVVLCVLGRL